MSKRKRNPDDDNSLFYMALGGFAVWMLTRHNAPVVPPPAQVVTPVAPQIPQGQTYPQGPQAYGAVVQPLPTDPATGKPYADIGDVPGSAPGGGTMNDWLAAKRRAYDENIAAGGDGGPIGRW